MSDEAVNISTDDGFDIESLTLEAHKYLETIQEDELTKEELLAGPVEVSSSLPVTASVVPATVPIPPENNAQAIIDTFNRLSVIPVQTENSASNYNLLATSIDASGSVFLPFIREMEMSAVLTPEEMELFQVARQNLKGEFTSKDRIIAILSRKVFELEHKFSKKMVNLLADKLQLPFEVMNNDDAVGRVLKPKKNVGYRRKSLTREEILQAQKYSKSIMLQAEYAGVSRSKYLKYCKIYGLYTPHKYTKVIRRYIKPESGKYPLSGILENKYPNVRDCVVKHKLLIAKKMYPACSICGYDKRRPKDNKICLLLDHIDNNKKNFQLDNLRLICYNCAYEYNREDLCSRKPYLMDPDWIQESIIYQIQKKYLW